MTEAKTYECMILLDNREVKTNWESLHGALQTIFTKHGAKVVSSKPWGERRLAYPIKRQTRATYLLNYLEAEPDQLIGIRRDLQFKESVLRNLIVVCEEVPEDVFGAGEFDPGSVQIDDLPELPTPEPKAEESEEDSGEAADAESDSSPDEETGEKASEETVDAKTGDTADDEKEER